MNFAGDTGPAAAAVTLVVGLLTYAGYRAVGALVLRTDQLHAPESFRAAAAPIIGLAAFSLLVELVAMAQLASPPLLVALWTVLAALGVVKVARWAVRSPRRPKPLSSPFVSVLLCAAAVAMVAALVVALAPSTKSDEVYYHMLVPRRIVEDGGLRFYRAPFEAAMTVQMLFQIGAAPLHALGVPDAANVVSWALAMTLLRFAWRFVSREQRDPLPAAVSVAVLASGSYVAVWQTTSGGHAFGDLATVLAVTLTAYLPRIKMPSERRGAAVLVAVLAACSAATKVTLWPLDIVVTLFAAWQVSAEDRRGVVARQIVPWVVIMGPAMVWTYLRSGSPFGSMFADVFGSSVYAPGEMSKVLAAVREQNSWQLYQATNLALLYSPLIWVLAVAAFGASELSRSTRTVLAAISVGQVLLVATLLPQEARFLGGLHFALVILACAHARPRAITMVSDWRGQAAVLALTLPWVAGQVYYTQTFAPVVVGAESRSDYEDANVALAADFRQLDALLPANAKLFVTGSPSRIPSLYAPRPVYFDARDIPRGDSVYVVAIGTEGDASLPRWFNAAPVVYENAAAIVATYRTPGRPPESGPVVVKKLKR